MPREIDPEIAKSLEKNARELGNVLDYVINRGNPGERKYGFTLLLYSFEGPEITYLCNSDRPSMIKAMEEILVRLKSGDNGVEFLKTEGGKK